MGWIKECFPDFEILIEYDNVDSKEKEEEIHGLKERKGSTCMFCGKSVEKWNKKDRAHAISECVGNKRLFNLCECYDCNHIFGEIAENHLGKFIMPYRIINTVYGKSSKNVIKDMPKNKNFSYEKFRFEQKKNSPVFESQIFEVYNMLIEEKGTDILTKTENGFILSIPRQTYEPQLVYVSLLKMAYTLLPFSELIHYIRGLSMLYLAVSLDPLYDEDGTIIVEKLTKDDQKKYFDSLPNLGIEICISSDDVPNGVNVCLLKRTKESSLEPKLLFAIQMKWYTIVIPVLSDNYQSQEINRFNCINNKNVMVKKIDFSKREMYFRCEMNAELIEIPQELYLELENDLKKCNLLKTKK